MTDKTKALIEALNKIASWDEGDVVGSNFDEPVCARLAREALAEFEQPPIREMTVEEVAEVVKEQIPSLYGIVNPHQDDFSNAKYAKQISANIGYALAKLGAIRVIDA